MILNENSFIYKDVVSLLTDSEVVLLLELIKAMNNENLVYLYQSSKRGKPTIDTISDKLGVSRKTIQNSISSIFAKQSEMRYILYKTDSGIKGEYFISPELAVHERHHYDKIYQDILPKIRNRGK